MLYDELGKAYLGRRRAARVIVCHCQVVSDSTVVDAIDSGARTLAGLCRSTGAGKNCGSCVFSLKRLLCEHGRLLSPLSPEVEVAAS